MLTNITKLIGLSLLVVFSISCKKEEANKDAFVTFKFLHQIDGQNVVFENVKYTNKAGNNYGVSTLEYFVSDIQLSDGNNSLSFNGAFYIDAKQGAEFKSSTTLPAGTYTKIKFTYGLTEELNQSGTFSNPPENLMEWPEPMGGGYHYMKLEGKFDSASVTKNYQAHTGRLMNTPHFVEFEFDNQQVIIDGSDVTINIIMDINKWWEDPNILDLNNVSGIMGNEEMQNALEENASNVFSVSTE